MSAKSTDEDRTKAAGKKTTPVALDPELAAEITKVSKRVNLSKQDTMRLSMQRGLPILLRQLTGNSEEVTA